MEIVTGSTGEVHVTPIDDAVRNGNTGYLSDRVVFTYFDNFAITERTANLMRISSGYGMNQGRLFKIDENDYDEVIIDNGSQGNTRVDLICARYTMNTQTGFEDISLVVIKGTSRTDGRYVDPEYNTTDINAMGDGLTAKVDDFPLYRIKINGLSIAAKEQMFTLVPDGGRIGVLEGRVTTLEGTVSSHINNTNNPHAVTKAQVGLGNADNTSDLNKPISNATQTALNAKAPTDHASTATTYGKSTSEKYGHAKLTDEYRPAEAGTANDGIGASQKAVKDAYEAALQAIGSAGYGDMMRATYDPDQDGVISPAQGGTGNTSLQATRNAMGLGNTTGALPVANGGTGTTDGTLNGVKLATSNGKYGYMDGNTFKSFRQPTGNAGAGDVLSGKTFATASSDAVTGTMTNRGAITASVNAGSQYTVPAGYHNGSGKVTANRYHDDNTYTFGSNNGATVDLGTSHNYRRVNAGNVYNTGRNQGQADKSSKSIIVGAEYNAYTNQIRIDVMGSDNNVIISEWVAGRVGSKTVSGKSSYNSGFTKT